MARTRLSAAALLENNGRTHMTLRSILTRSHDTMDIRGEFFRLLLESLMVRSHKRRSDIDRQL